MTDERGSCPVREGIDELIERSRSLPPMTREERREQMVSFVYGQVTIGRPNVSREFVEEMVDRHYANRV